MRSNNPVFNRSEAFNGSGQNAHNQTFAGQYGQPGYPQAGGYVDPTQYDTTRVSDRMTIDSVVQKTAISLGVIVVVAAATWVLSGDLFTSDGFVIESTYTKLMMLTIVGGVGALVMSLVNSFKRVASPPLVLLFSVFEGLVIGAATKISVAIAGSDVLVGAVLGTVAAVGGTLAAYKFFNIQVSDRMRKFVVAAMFGFVALSLLDLLLMMFGASVGINGYGTVGLIASVVGLVIAVFMLLLDFDFIERGVAAGLPDSESWRAAFGLTVTIVWIYMNLLRILTILNRN
jgi:uncharacterized YccA/Bax inhibitor family protein